MKKSMKRIIAMFCAFAMLAGGLWTGAGQTANAAVWTDNQLVVYQNKVIESAMLHEIDHEIDLSGKDIANLSLYVKMTFTEEQYNQATSNGQVKNWRIKFSNYADTSKTNGYEVQVNPTIDGAGTYEETFSLESWAQTTSDFSLDKVIRSCRIYNGDAVNQKMTGVVINVIKFIYTPQVDTPEEDNNTETHVWTIYENKATSENLVANVFTDTSLNIDLSEKKDAWSQLSLYVRMAVSDASAVGSWRIKFSNYSSIDGAKEIKFEPNITTTGVYENTFSFAEMGDSSRLNLSEAIKSCRVYKNDDTNSHGVIIEEMNIIYTPNEWTVYKNKALTATEMRDSGLNVNLDKQVVDKYNLSLYLKMDIPNDTQVTPQWRIKLSNSTTINNQEAYFAPNVTATGEFEYRFSFLEIQNGGNLDLSEAIRWCGIWINGGSVNGATIKEMKIIYTPTLRGDWRDPDDTSEGDYGTIVKVEMTAETDPQTFSDSAYHGVFELNAVSGAVGLTVCYPNQNLDNVIEYPHTFYIVGGMLPSVRDVTVINGYRGIGAAINPDGSSHESLQVENFKGTFLNSGLYLEYSADVGTVKNVVISNKYWLNCLLSDVQIPAETVLDTYTQEYATGIKLGAVEWTEFVNVSITDCNIGIHTVEGRRSEQEIWFAGSFYDLQISECVTGLQADYLDTRWGMNVAKSSIAGFQNSIVNNINSVTNEAGFIQLCDVTFTGDIQDSEGKVVEDSTQLGEQVIQYEQSYIAPDNRMVIANLSDYTTGKDASVKLQNCLDWMYRAGGGVVYVPSGIYRFDKPLNVPEGVELRGASSVATRDISAKCGGTLFLCYYGDEGSGDGTAFITLDGKNAGVNGIRITYAENGVLTNTTTNKTLKTTYTIRGKADGVYVVHSVIAGSGYGVDFGNCDNYYIDGVYTACYYTTYYLGGSGGVITGCLQNPTVYSRTVAPVERDTWGEEDTIWGNLYNTIRTNAHYIILEDARDALVYNNFAYGVMTMLSNVESSGTQVVNMGTDRLGPSSAHLIMDGGSLFAVNILRCDTITSEITDYLPRGVVSKAFKYIEGDLKLHNRLKLWLKAGDVANEPAISKENVKSISLANGDSLDRIHAVSYGLEISTTMKKEGTGSYYVSGRSKARFEGQLTQTIDISANKNGKLYLWFYVNNRSYLAQGYPLIVKIGSSTTTNSLEWNIPLSQLNSGGWTEIVLDLNSPDTVKGTIDFSAINYINVHQNITAIGGSYYQDSRLVTAVDDIRVVAPTESGEIADKKLVFGCGDSALTGLSNVRYSKYVNVPVNIKAYKKGALQLRLYINDVENFTSAGAVCVEIGSSRRCDCEELQWTIPSGNLKSGWNDITLPFSDAVASGMVHLGAVDYLRVYYTGNSSESMTTQLADIYAILGKELGGNITGGSDTSDWNEWFE